jgi:hypothetical protein
LTLLSTLQREARLLDLVGESLDQYSDAQIGAAARDVLRDTKKSLDRMLGIKPLVEGIDGDKVEIPDAASSMRWKIIGTSAKQGTLVHHGWVASRVEIPDWHGASTDSLVLNAAEVET